MLPRPDHTSQRRLWPAALVVAGLVLWCSWIIGLPTAYWKTASLNYDDSEYAYQAIDTVDRLHQRGLLAWPQIIHDDQHYGKPPLFVNSLAAAIEMTGRDRPIGGIQLATIASSFVLLASVAFFFGRRYGPAGGLLAVLAVVALPAFISWAPRVVPDIQVTILAFAATALLAANPRGALPLQAGIALGLVWGFGMHSKATYPLYAIGPVLVWIAYAPSLQRAASLLPATLLAAALTAVWYLPNFDEAIQYVRGAVDFIDDPDQTRAARFGQWLKTLSLDAFGWILAALVLAAAFIRIRHRRDAGNSREHGLLVWTLLAAAMPMLLLALTSSAPPNTRHPLPSLVLIVLLAVSVLLNHWRTAARGRLFQYAAIGLLALQAGVFLADIQRADRPDAERRSLQMVGRLLAPGFLRQQAIDDTLPLQAFAVASATMGTTPAIIYLAGHDGSLHVPKLNLLAIIKRSSLRFDYATYFSWSDEESRARLDRIAGIGEPILVLEHKQADKDGASRYFYQHQSLGSDLVKNAAGLGYADTLLADTPKRRLDLLVSRHQARANSLSLQAVDANFADMLAITGVAIDGGELVVRVRSTARVDKNYKLMLHAAAREEPQSMAALDQYILPSLATWQPGNQRDIRVRLPAALDGKALRLGMGFFDESDEKNNWPRLRTLDGMDSVTIDLPIARAMNDEQTPRLSPSTQ